MAHLVEVEAVGSIAGSLVVSRTIELGPLAGPLASPLASEYDRSVHLPRIVCLHGGGTNARIFRAQCRVLRAHLAPFFRLVFADAPFPSRPGPDVESVYAEWGPFRSWLPPAPGGGLTTTVNAIDQDVVERIEQSLAAAMREDDDTGATGAWVGLLGFSQGAKMAASLLWRQQQQSQNRSRMKGWEGEADGDDSPRHQDHTPRKSPKMDCHFAVLMAGRAPLVSLGPDTRTLGLLQLPTIHVHGLRDAGISMHRDLLHRHCEKGSVSLVEWDGDHRVPIQTKDVGAVVVKILHVARATGVLRLHDS
jgi:hypothetical protein